jgi:hypothetical protein
MHTTTNSHEAITKALRLECYYPERTYYVVPAKAGEIAPLMVVSDDPTDRDNPTALDAPRMRVLYCRHCHAKVAAFDRKVQGAHECVCTQCGGICGVVLSA